MRTYRIQRGRPRWLYTQVARLGADAEILAPADVRRGMAAFLDSILEAAAGPESSVGERADEERSSPPTATAAARPRPRRPRTRKKPRRDEA